ncbi:MAG: CDP-alcohol phosphatidyltransferase family protein [Candidatus Micrarchaeota archaeon]|nr:CDP-alcohol phosphatidyltransferase family protein [Candidatus Micrarchaeota archaeon]
MRSADMVSLFRLVVLALVIYLVLVKYSATVVIPLIVFLFLLDWVDGYLAAQDEKAPPRYGAYLDIAIDRIIEYAFWLLFTLLSILPWFVIAIVFARNTVADYLVTRKGMTFSSMKSGFGRIASSHIIRGAYAVLKAVNFAYLALIVVLGLPPSGWPILVAYGLTTVVVAFSLIRGAAEIHEALR